MSQYFVHCTAIVHCSLHFTSLAALNVLNIAKTDIDANYIVGIIDDQLFLLLSEKIPLPCLTILYTFLY